MPKLLILFFIHDYFTYYISSGQLLILFFIHDFLFFIYILFYILYLLTNNGNPPTTPHNRKISTLDRKFKKITAIFMFSAFRFMLINFNFQCSVESATKCQKAINSKDEAFEVLTDAMYGASVPWLTISKTDGNSSHPLKRLTNPLSDSSSCKGYCDFTWKTKLGVTLEK